MGELGELNPSKLKGFVSCVCNLSREQSSLDYGRSPTRDSEGHGLVIGMADKIRQFQKVWQTIGSTRLQENVVRCEFLLVCWARGRALSEMLG